MELHFLLGFPKTGKSTFIDRYCNNEKIKNFYTFDFNIQFKKYFEGSKNDINILNQHLSIINSNDIFIEIPIKNVGQYDSYKILEKFTIEWINKNITISNNYKKEDIFIHIFETSSPTFNYNISSYDKIHNLLIHQYCLLFDNYIKYFNNEYINNIKRDKEFDWNIMYTKKYLNFKHMNGFKDFILLKCVSNVFKERSYSSDWVSCNHKDKNIYYSIIEIIQSIKHPEDIKSIDYFDGKKLEKEGIVKINYILNDYYSETLYKYKLFSIPHLFKFLEG